MNNLLLNMILLLLANLLKYKNKIINHLCHYKCNNFSYLDQFPLASVV